MNQSSSDSIWSNKKIDWTVKENIESELLHPEYGSTYWYKAWEDQFLDSLKFSNHELIDQPVVFFYVLNIADDNLEDQILYLDKIKLSSPRYKEATYDNDFPHIYLFINDQSAGVSEDVALLKLEKLERKYSRGLNICHLLRIQKIDV